jgi:hypothetical protein
VAHWHSMEETFTVATVAGGRHTRRSSGNGQQRLLQQHEATSVDVLRVREENGEVSSGTARPTREAGGDFVTREREEAAPSSAFLTATTLLSLTAHGNDLHGGEDGGSELQRWPAWRDDGGVASSYWRRRRWGEEERCSATTGRFIARVEDDAVTGGSQVGGWHRQVGPVSASAPLTGGLRCNCFPSKK